MVANHYCFIITITITIPIPIIVIIHVYYLNGGTMYDVTLYDDVTAMYDDIIHNV
jgi:hypothetical protein